MTSNALLLCSTMLFITACDPPCRSYWEARCKACGEDSPGCAHAKHAAEHELGEAAQCEKLTNLEKSSTDLARGRYCELHKNDPRSLDELRGPSICNGLRVDFRGPSAESTSSSNPQQIVVGEQATTIHNVRTAMFQVEGKPACNYWLGPHEHSAGEPALAILCPVPVAELPSEKLVHCLREAKR